MHDTNDNILSVKELDVVYHSGKSTVYAVSGVSFDLKWGQTLALVGETGAGKTTIAKAILRILPEPQAEIRSGSITFEGSDMVTLSDKELSKIRGAKIAMIFQDPMTALNPLQTVGDQIMEGLLLHNDYSQAEAKERTRELLELVGIPKERMVEYPFEFSGGMKQRVIIAMALACNPDLLLADEPTTALDVTIQAQVLELIAELRQKFNSAMVLITHDLGVVAQNSDYVAIVYAGQIMEYGSREDIFLHPSHPYTIGLFNSLPDLSSNVKRLRPIPGAMPDPTIRPQGCPFAPRCDRATDECRTGEVIEIKELAPGHLCRCIKSKLEEFADVISY